MLLPIGLLPQLAIVGRARLCSHSPNQREREEGERGTAKREENRGDGAGACAGRQGGMGESQSLSKNQISAVTQSFLDCDTLLMKFP